MSAMHWEARRRQSVLDRKQVNQEKQSSTEEDKQGSSSLEESPKETSKTPSEQKANDQPLEVNERITHPSHLSPVKEEDTEKKNRSTNTQYFQQW